MPQAMDPQDAASRANQAALAGRTFTISGERLAELEAIEARESYRLGEIAAEEAAAGAARAAGEASAAPWENDPVLVETNEQFLCLRLRMIQDRLDEAQDAHITGRALIARHADLAPGVARAGRVLDDNSSLAEAVQLAGMLERAFCPSA